MYAMRRWSVRHAGAMERAYRLVEAALVGCSPLLRRLGHRRLERPFAFAERVVKGFFFDCRMCGSCVLSSTGMSCPMNCPKQLRNGPCGGVRFDGRCEVAPRMQCVWVDAWEGSRRMGRGESIRTVQVAVDFSAAGRSAWLHHLREHERRTAAAPAGEAALGSEAASEAAT